MPDRKVEEFKKRREQRLRQRHGADYDAVAAYKERRAARLDDKGRWVTTEKDHRIHLNEHGEPDKGNPHVISVMKGGKGGPGSKGPDQAGAKQSKSTTSGTTGAGLPKMKGVTYKKSESGFEVPTFDEATFTENIEEKKKIARQAAKKLIPEIKKTMSTEVKSINRPEVNDETRAYLKKSVEGATPEQIEKGLQEAEKIYSYWAEHEPAITDAVVGAVKDIGGTMYGLDNRRKFDKSLAKKAIADALDPSLKYNGDIAKAAADIKDGARYTAVFESDNFAEGYKRIKEALGKMGIREYRCKNFFTQYRDQDGSKGKIGEQKSVQCVFETPDGQKFELQFHTPESMAAKEVNHPTYKQKKEPASEHKEYNEPRSRFMRDTSSVVPDPKGVFDIEEHKKGETGYQ